MPGRDKCGVYVIEQTGTGRCYIGSSRAIYKRWFDHRRLLNRGAHHAPFLQHAWTKHGADAFVFHVLEECEPSALLAREQEYLDAFLPSFNVCPKAGSPQGVTDTPEVRAKKSRVHRERLAVRTHCPKGHPYDAENTAVYGGARYCRECARQNTRQHKAGWSEERWTEHRAQQRDYYRRVRGGGKGSYQARITHCPAGHPYDEANTCVSNGRRSCRACGRERMRDRRSTAKGQP